MSELLSLCLDLISRPSISPEDSGCQDLLAARLEALGFTVERLPFGPVSNFWARRGGAGPLLCFAGHTDVVPPGPLGKWQNDPFTPQVRDGLLYGRGAADMKGSLAAMIVACERFLEAHPDPRGSLAFLITSDEESAAVDGTRRVVEELERRGEKIDWCIVGEPSSSERLGDTVKNGRRGSLNGILKVKGQLGHVAYPQLAVNPIHRFLPALSELCRVEWDLGNDYFPPTSFQISNIHSGTGANNVIPEDMDVLFNFRFSTETTVEEIQRRTHEVFDRYYQDYRLDWQLSGNPFLTPEGALTEAVAAAVEKVSGARPALSTSGGTSDGRFIAPTGAQVVELGPRNASIHKIDEHVSVAELEDLARIYQEIMHLLL